MSTLAASPQTESTSTWGSRFAALGPGLLMASAAIGGSHLVSSTQAGAMFQWQLIIVIILANLLKYPFFRFGPQYTMETGQNLVEGYATKGKVYLWVFFILCAGSSVVSLAGVGLLCSVILATALPASWGLSVSTLAIVMMTSVWIILIAGKYRALDRLTKVIMVVLTISTVFTVAVAASRGAVAPAGTTAPSPWNLATLPFLVALVGWMPAPVEISALQSLWIKAKQRISPANMRDVMFDFNIGYVTSAILALFFLSMGALVQFGSGEEIQTAGGAYIPQLIAMYSATIGAWSQPIMATIAFLVMFGTTIAVADGYARASGEALHLISGGTGELSRRSVMIWTTLIAAVGLGLIIWMSAQLGEMLRFAMISAFITAPIFAWLNFSLVRGQRHLSPLLKGLSWVGLIFLGGFTIFFLLYEIGFIG